MDVNLLFTGLIFSSLGMGYIAYGRKQAKMTTFLSGVGLCVFPYFVSNLWLSIFLGLIFTALPFVVNS